MISNIDDAYRNMAQYMLDSHRGGRFIKKKKQDLDVKEIKKSLMEKGEKFTNDDFYGRMKRIDRGWGAADVVGWGVLGHYGSSERDIGAQVRQRNEKPQQQKSQLTRNENGLWVKADKSTVQPKLEKTVHSTHSLNSDAEGSKLRKRCLDTKRVRHDTEFASADSNVKGLSLDTSLPFSQRFPLPTHRAHRTRRDSSSSRSTSRSNSTYSSYSRSLAPDSTPDAATFSPHNTLHSRATDVSSSSTKFGKIPHVNPAASSGGRLCNKIECSRKRHRSHSSAKNHSRSISGSRSYAY